LVGGDAEDGFAGQGGDDFLDGRGGADNLLGGDGKDTLVGGAGMDTLVGGDGIDTVIFGGRRSDYQVEQLTDGSLRITDLRATSPDGADTVSSLERFRFADGELGRDQLLHVNQAPAAGDDVATIAEDGSVVVDVLANDTDPNAGDTKTIVSVDAPAISGSTMVTADGRIVYMPGAAFNSLAAGESATDRFTYTMRDAAGLTSTATVRLTIEGVNDAPVAVADAATVGEDGRVTLNLLANDSDPDHGAVLRIGDLSVDGMKGSLIRNADGTVTYDPGSVFQHLVEGESATDSFTYSVVDGFGGRSTATVIVTVEGAGVAPPPPSPGNRAPSAGIDTVRVLETSGAVNLTQHVLANDSDPDEGDSFSITSAQLISQKGAVVTLSADGQLVYDPDTIFADLRTGETGTDSFTYTITDSGGLSSTATIRVRIEGVSQADATVGAVEDETTTYEDLGELVGFAIVGVDTLGMFGTLELVDGVVTYTADDPDLDVAVPDTFLYTSFAVLGAEGQRAVIDVQVLGTNDPITGVDDSLSIEAGEATGNLFEFLLSNDIDVDAVGGETNQRIIEVLTEGTLGEVLFEFTTDSLSYSAEGLDLAPGQTLTDSFVYVVRDAYGSVSQAKVTVTVTGEAPVANHAFESGAGFDQPWAGYDPGQCGADPGFAAVHYIFF
jgi:VCBS repeat-containing protein